jgi:tRNA threonylcarbamoyladenosine biosynthesis protein TsaB
VTPPDRGLLLGIETAAGLVGVALADERGPIAGAWLRGERGHAEALAPAICHVLGQVGASPGDLGAIALDVGPGLFTGLRVGVATAQGLAQGLGIGIVTVTSVEVLAREAYDAGWEGPVAAIVDARRGEVFAACCAGPGEDVDAPWRDAPADLVDKLAAAPGTLCVGTGAQRYADVLGAAHLRVAAIDSPSPRALVAIGAARLDTGAAVIAPHEVRPVYLREADARINWVQR